MKQIIGFLIVILLISCKKEDTSTIDKTVTDIKENTEVVAKEGSGKITLKCNGKEIITEGVCGALVSMGQLTIAVKDKTNPAKVFTIDFNDENYPKEGIIYKIKARDYTSEGEQPKDEISVSFSEGLPNNKMNTWGSEKAEGTLEFKVAGNEIKCLFKDIKLQANEMFNADDLQGVGLVSGEFTVWKNE